MSYAQQLVQANPGKTQFDTTALAACIEACFDCAQACTACADACLGERDTTMLLRCIRLDLDCADLCAATGRILSRQTATDPAMVRAALQACKRCGDECEQHGQHGMELLSRLRRGMPPLRAGVPPVAIVAGRVAARPAQQTSWARRRRARRRRGAIPACAVALELWSCSGRLSACGRYS